MYDTDICNNCLCVETCEIVGKYPIDDCEYFKNKDNFAELKNMKWRPHYYIFEKTKEKMRDGWHCSVCGKHSWSRKEVCDGCNTTMWKVELR